MKHKITQTRVTFAMFKKFRIYSYNSLHLNKN